MRRTSGTREVRHHENLAARRAATVREERRITDVDPVECAVSQCGNAVASVDQRLVIRQD